MQKFKTMKHTLILSVFIIAVMSSCKKDLPTDNEGHPDIQPPYFYNLVANHWARDANGFYNNKFQGLMALASSGSNGSRVAKVYLVTTNGEIQINHFIFFMGGELWAATTPPDLIIYFRYSGHALPFSFLQIKLVVE